MTQGEEQRFPVIRTGLDMSFMCIYICSICYIIHIFCTYFLYFYNPAHLPFSISLSLACNIIFVFFLSCFILLYCSCNWVFSSKSLRLGYGLLLQLGFLNLSIFGFVFQSLLCSICFAFIRGFSSGRLDFACLTAS